MHPALPLDISPQELKQRMDGGQCVHLVDVREPQEYELARLEGAELIPMRNVPAALTRLEAAADEVPLVVLCHHGVRSLNVVVWLRQQGLEECQSLAGGIDRWSLEIDSSIPRY